MNLWAVILAIGVLTYAIRLSFILLLERVEISPVFARALRLVPAAVLSAIIFPEILIRDGKFALSLSNDRLLAGALAFLVAWRTKNAFLTVIVGMASLYMLQTLIR
jgi:branched-subunit amino acid transport protein